jgi:ornithine cyclodeaminase
MALIGNGAQASSRPWPFTRCWASTNCACSTSPRRPPSKLQRNLATVPGLTLRRAASVIQAVRGADIVTTATASKSHACIVTPAMLEPGMHLNAVGGDCPGKTELHPDVLRAARIVVEYAPQTRVEGEIQQLPADHPVTELWQVLAGQASASSSQICTSFSLGRAQRNTA